MMDLSRENLRFIIDNANRFMSPEMMHTTDDNKFLLSYINSMVGRYELQIEPYAKNKRPIRQKEIRGLSLLSSKNVHTIARLYDYSNICMNTEERIDKYVENAHIADTIYGIIGFLLLEEKHTLRGVSFKEHIGELKKKPSIDDIHSFYQDRRRPEDPIRNNRMLVFIRNPEVTVYEKYFHYDMAAIK